MILRRASLLVAVVLVAAACGGGVTGVAPVPTPTPTPPGTTGSVSGTVGVSVTKTAPRFPELQVSSGIRRQPVGAPEFVADQLLVKFKAGITPDQATSLHRQYGALELRRIEKVGVSVLKITSGDPVQAVVNRYRADPAVQYAEPNFYRYLNAVPFGPRPQAVPNDQYYNLQWHYVNVNLPGAWDVTTGSSLVVVAVIDSGILFSHPDLVGVTVQGYDFVDNDTNPEDPGCEGPSDFSHGAHVAGTIAAATNNVLGVAGVNWGGPGKTKIMPLRIFGNYGGVCTATTEDIIAAIQYAADRSARVINMSFGGGPFSQFEQDAVTYAYNTGVILIASAGNSNTSALMYPVCYANVVGVSATDYANNKAWYSNYGSCIDLAAPGGDTLADLNGDGYKDGVLSTTGATAATPPYRYIFEQGTSMAAPHVAGLAALLISKGVTGPLNIQNVMQSSATDLGGSGWDSIYGWGLINAAAAVGVPVPTNPLRAFSGNISGSTITVASDVVVVASNGNYFITNAQTGTRTVFAWQDTNGNGVVDGGDLYGTVPGVVINPGATTTGVSILVAERPFSSPPITVSGITRTSPR